MQPTFIPWLGYFELIYSSDIFVFYDTAQYQKSSWHNRNKVLNKNNEIWLSIPVKRRNLKQSLSDSKFDETKKKWRLKFSQTFVQAYSRHDHFHEMSWLASEICSSEQQSLSEFNIDLIQKICKVMGIEKKFFRAKHLAEHLDFDGKRTLKSLLALHWQMLLKMQLTPETILCEEGVLNRHERLAFKSRHLLGLEREIPIFISKQSNQSH